MPTCRLDERVGEVRTRPRAAGWSLAAVVNDDRVVLGLLEREALEGAGDTRVESVMRPTPVTFRPHHGAGEAAEWMRSRGAEGALVTTSDGVLLGFLWRDDAERAAAREPAA